MTTSSERPETMTCRRAESASRGLGVGMACAALAMLFLTGGTPTAMADPIPNRVFADCVLEHRSGGSRINTLAGLQADILRTNTPNPNDPEIESPAIAYVVIYAVDNDNNGQRVVNGRNGPLLGFTGPVICVNPAFNISSTLQTTDIPNIDILDLQDALILRHAPAGTPSGAPGANRFCHTTDGNTDCFNIR
jgi:hypothetical protein